MQREQEAATEHHIQKIRQVVEQKGPELAKELFERCIRISTQK